MVVKSCKDTSIVYVCEHKELGDRAAQLFWACCQGAPTLPLPTTAERIPSVKDACKQPESKPPVLADWYDWRCARNWGAPWSFWCVRGYEEVFEVEGIRLVRTEVPLMALRCSRLVWGVRSLWRCLVLLPSWAAWWAYGAHYWCLCRTSGSFLKTKYSVCAYIIEIKLPALPLLKFIYAKNVGTSVAGHGSNL